MYVETFFRIKTVKSLTWSITFYTVQLLLTSSYSQGDSTAASRFTIQMKTKDSETWRNLPEACDRCCDISHKFWASSSQNVWEQNLPFPSSTLLLRMTLGSSNTREVHGNCIAATLLRCVATIWICKSPSYGLTNL